MINLVRLSVKRKVLAKLPHHVGLKLQAWIRAVQSDGLEQTMKRSGYHDHPLQGPRAGQRAVRLNKQWRAIYAVDDQGEAEIVDVIEVTPHDY